jgi:FkbM family methyltransferase
MIRDEIEALFELNDYPENAFDIEAVFNGNKIILYGAGECSIWFFEIVRDIFGYSPTVILDEKFGEPTQFEGVDAMSLSDYRPTQEDLEEAVVVICTGDESVSSIINTTLHQFGFKKVIHLRDVYEIHNPFREPSELNVKKFAFYKEQKEKVLTAFDLFSDEESQQVFLAYLKSHMLRKPVYIPNRPREEQFFPKDIDIPQGYSSFISCGSYDGDTVRLLNHLHGKVDEIICFEAEPAIYQRLVSFIETNKEKLANNIITFPCAVFDSEKIVKFTSSTGLGSRISASGTINIQSVALDHVLPTIKPSIITMDIEGAEPLALKGAESMISRSKPALGICVYHSPNHLWDIPLYLNDLNMNYKFHLRNYTSFGIETVLYAT